MPQRTLADFPRLMNAVIKAAPYDVITALRFGVVGAGLVVSVEAMVKAGSERAGASYRLDMSDEEAEDPSRAVRAMFDRLGLELAEKQAETTTRPSI